MESPTEDTNDYYVTYLLRVGDWLSMDTVSTLDDGDTDEDWEFFRHLNVQYTKIFIRYRYSAVLKI